jgi:hypothetical protein
MLRRTDSDQRMNSQALTLYIFRAAFSGFVFPILLRILSRKLRSNQLKPPKVEQTVFVPSARAAPSPRPPRILGGSVLMLYAVGSRASLSKTKPTVHRTRETRVPAGWGRRDRGASVPSGQAATQRFESSSLQLVALERLLAQGGARADSSRLSGGLATPGRLSRSIRRATAAAGGCAAARL